MQMTAILPTVFFIETEHGLCQRVQIELVNEGQAAQATLQVTGDQETETVDLGIIVAGHTTVDLYLRDRRTAQKLTFVLCSAGTVQSQQILDWQPQRHWEVHLIHYIHHDLGYTDIPSNVLREYDDHFDQVLRFCAETAPWPETDARFRFQCEQAWSLLHWIEHRPPEAVEQMIGFVKKGQIEVTALFGNMTLELCGHEEMIRLLYPAFALKHRYGIPITSAEHNDIPGFAWGLASVLAGAGIRYFSPGIPLWYFGEGEERVHPLWDTTAALPLTIPAACWWEGPDGQKVLLWSDLHGREWQPYNYDQALQELPQMLRHLEENEYPYEMVSYTLRGGHRDNAPPTRLFADLVREWNRRWAYPKLINTTNTPFLQKFEQRWGHTLKTLRGDVPGTDYPVAATCTPKETALSRNSHDALVTAETLATLASCLGDYAYPQATLQEAYRQLFYYDEHCWGLAHVGGPAMDAHWSDKSNFVYKAAALAHDITIKAANKLVDQINLPTDDWSIVIFNPLAHTRTDVVRVPLRELFLAFPFLVEQAQFHFEATNAVIEPTVDQWPGSNSDAYAVQHWVHIGNAGGGIVWTPLDAPMAEFGGLWPGYVSGAHHGVTGPGYGHPFLPPGELTSSHIYSLVSYNNFRTNFLNVQPGEFLVRYAFTAQRGDWRNGQARTFGWNVANPPLAVWLKGPQAGMLHTATSFCQIDAPNITLLACKRAEDGDGVILRLIETEGKETLATITLPQVAFSRVFVTNLVEENLCLLAHHNHSIQAPLQPYAIATLRLA